MFCCSSKATLIQEAASLLELANKEVDECCTGNMGTDSQECVTAVCAVTAHAKHPICNGHLYPKTINE